MLSAILIGNNIVNLSASSLMTIFSTNVFGSRSVGAATGVLTLLVLIFGEISPRPWPLSTRSGSPFYTLSRSVP